MRVSFILSLLFICIRWNYGFSTMASRGSVLQRILPGWEKQRFVSTLITTKTITAAATTAKTTTTTTMRVCSDMGVPLSFRGGFGGTKSSTKSTTQLEASPAYKAESKCPVTRSAAICGSIWGTGGVLYILVKAIKRVIPIALEPFQGKAVPLSQYQLGAYILTCLWFAYVEGYKGFQQKFSPLVVTRSFTLIPGKNGTTWYHFLLAPFYCMALIHATPRRQIVSWSVTIGVTAIVALVKRLPYPWRNILDAGVVVGLSWGTLSIIGLYIQAWWNGKPPTNVDASLPANSTK